MPRRTPFCTCTWVIGSVSRGFYAGCEYCFLVSFREKSISEKTNYFCFFSSIIFYCQSWVTCPRMTISTRWLRRVGPTPCTACTVSSLGKKPKISSSSWPLLTPPCPSSSSSSAERKTDPPCQILWYFQTKWNFGSSFASSLCEVIFISKWGNVHLYVRNNLWVWFVECNDDIDAINLHNFSDWRYVCSQFSIKNWLFLFFQVLHFFYCLGSLWCFTSTTTIWTTSRPSSGWISLFWNDLEVSPCLWME